MEDPFVARPGADVKELAGGRYAKYRLRLGDYRVIYYVEGSIVRLLDVWHRGRERY